MSGHYEYLVEQRDAILSRARMSPEAKTRAMGLATPVTCPDPAAVAQAEVARLTGANEELRAIIRRLEEERAGLTEQMRLANEGAQQARVMTRKVSIADVQKAFCEEYSDLSGKPYTLVDLASPRRNRAMAWPRMTCMDLVRRLCPVSYPTISKAFGNRDHTTVMHALLKAPDHMASDPQLADAHARIIARFTVRQ